MEKLNTIIHIFNQLWQSGETAHLNINTHAGQAWLGLTTPLGYYNQPHQYTPHQPHPPQTPKAHQHSPYSHTNRSPSYYRRQQRRKANKAADVTTTNNNTSAEQVDHTEPHNNISTEQVDPHHQETPAEQVDIETTHKNTPTEEVDTFHQATEPNINTNIAAKLVLTNTIPTTPTTTIPTTHATTIDANTTTINQPTRLDPTPPDNNYDDVTSAEEDDTPDNDYDDVTSAEEDNTSTTPTPTPTPTPNTPPNISLQQFQQIITWIDTHCIHHNKGTCKFGEKCNKKHVKLKPDSTCPICRFRCKTFGQFKYHMKSNHDPTNEPSNSMFGI